MEEKQKQSMELLKGVFIINEETGEVVKNGLENKNHAKEELKSLNDGNYVFGQMENKTRMVKRETKVIIHTENNEEE